MTDAHPVPIQKAVSSALEWLADQGVDCLLKDVPEDRTQSSPSITAALMEPSERGMVDRAQPSSPEPQIQAAAFLGVSDARAEAVRLAGAAQTLDELCEAIAGFDGLAVKKTASHMVFSDGHPEAHVMLIGEAPGAEEDRQGRPFVGESGQLLDRVFSAMGFDRHSASPEKGVYISNILNWRPPGNRTPSPAEVQISLPFIERHIQLAAPRVLILCGGVSAKALLGQEVGISRLRKIWHDYRPVTQELGVQQSIPALATYHPSYLLRTPVQKKLVWSDVIEISQKIKNM